MLMSNRLFNENDGMDEDSCLAMYDNDYDFYKLVLDTFHQDIIRTRSGMVDTFAAKDVENYRIFVHGLKGAGGSAGAKRLVELATVSNDLIKAGNVEEAYKLHQPLLDELDNLIRIIPERIQAHNG